MPRASWVAYVGPFLFPWGQAGSRRVYGIARALAASGLRVVVGSGDERTSETRLLEAEGGGELRCLGLGELYRNDRSRTRRAFKVLAMQGALTVRWLDAQREKPSHVVVYGGYASFMARMLRWGAKNRVPVVADVVEWYDPTHVPGGRLGPFNISTQVALRHYFPRCSGIIAISSYLEHYYQARGVRVLRVPPTLDVAAVKTGCAEAGADGPLVLIYAGSPGKKDLLANVIRGFQQLDAGAQRVRLDVLGASEPEVRRLLGSGETLPRSVRVLGRIPQERVRDAYLAADFSVLLREPVRYAHAGFPTKVPESLAAGVPVICNLTSDLGEHVHDGVEGLVCEGPSPSAFAAALRRAIDLPPTRRAAMRRAARAEAERSFDYRVYTDALARFFAEVQQ